MRKLLFAGTFLVGLLASPVASAVLPPAPVPEVRLTVVRDRGSHVTCYLAYLRGEPEEGGQRGFGGFIGGPSCLRD